MEALGLAGAGAAGAGAAGAGAAGTQASMMANALSLGEAAAGPGSVGIAAGLPEGTAIVPSVGSSGVGLFAPSLTEQKAIELASPNLFPTSTDISPLGRIIDTSQKAFAIQKALKGLGSGGGMPSLPQGNVQKIKKNDLFTALRNRLEQDLRR